MSNILEMPAAGLTKKEITQAFLNIPELAARTVKLGDREFPILDFGYDDYTLFLAQLEPLFKGLLGMVPGVSDFGAASDMLTPAALFAYCGKSLPEMGRIVCAQSDPTITVADVKRLAGNPFDLATLVLAQIEQNGMISKVKDFFVQFLPLLMRHKKR